MNLYKIKGQYFNLDHLVNVTHFLGNDTQPENISLIFGSVLGPLILTDPADVAFMKQWLAVNARPFGPTAG